VDAYPIGPDGKIIEGLSAGDFRILEDGKPQQIESSEFIRIDLNTFSGDRRDPNSQAEGNRLAADPRNRVFVVFLDRFHGSLYGSTAMRQPLVTMLHRMLAPNDLFGVATYLTRGQDLVLGRQTETIEDQLERHWQWGYVEGAIDLQPEEQYLQTCYGDAMALRIVARTREEKTLDAITGLMNHLGSLREARKVFIVFSKGWPLYKPDRGQADRFLIPSDGKVPPVGISTGGTLTMARGEGPGVADWNRCSTELIRAFSLDNQRKFQDLMALANRNNVTFYPVDPGGVTSNATGQWSLRSLAQETDGFSPVSNDLNASLTRIAEDVSAYYVLGYYSNAKPDGAFHRIEVQVTRTNAKVKARRGFVAPAATEGGPASVAAKPSTPSGLTDALGVLSRLRPSAELFLAGSVDDHGISVVAELAGGIASTGAWLDGATIVATASGAAGAVAEGKGRIEPGTRGGLVRLPAPSGGGPYRVDVRVTSGRQEISERLEVSAVASKGALLGTPLLYRATPAASSPLRPIADMQYRRTERAHIEWPIRTPVDHRSARLLSRDGSPLPVPATLTERESNGTNVLALDLNLAPLAVGDYVIEVTAGAGTVSDTVFVALRIRQ
jgi:VWFA-related protein